MGGAIMCNDDDFYFKCWQLVNHGRVKHDDYTETANLKDRFTFDVIGYSLKYADLNAAMGLAQHYNRDNIIEARQYIGLLLTEKLQQLGFQQGSNLMPVEDNTYMMFPIVLDEGMDRDRIIAALNENNIETRMLMPITTQPVVKRLFGNDVEDKYPNARFLNRYGFYVGSHPMMSDEDTDKIASVLKDVIQ
jgi:dTDP-4-amino-4,6-dideoxygalactose transaminase